MIELGLDVERLRKERNLSQVELAHLAGITRMTLRKIEAGKSVAVYILLQVLDVFDKRLVIGDLEEA